LAARLMAGDAPGADKIATAQLQKIAKTNPQAAATLQPLWTAITKAATPEARKQLIEAQLIRSP
jgi:hypothetical protein